MSKSNNKLEFVGASEFLEDLDPDAEGGGCIAEITNLDVTRFHLQIYKIIYD